MLLLEDKSLIFNNVAVPSEFGKDSDYNEVTTESYEFLEQFGMPWETGASKAVLFPQGVNYVIKLGFNGFLDTYSDGYYNEDDEWVEEEQEETWCPFCEANRYNEDCASDDYCEIEYDNYWFAIDEKVDRYFAKIDLVGYTQNGRGIFMQEKIIPYYTYIDSDNYRKPSEASYTKAKEKRSEICKEWVACFLDKYGEKEYDRLMDFIYDHDIDDLHNGNIGFRQNGDPVIMDYSSFHD